MLLRSVWCVGTGILTLLVLTSREVRSANILFYHGAACSYSHQAGMVPLVEGLVLRGHNVTHSSPYPYYGKSRVTEFCPVVTQRDHDELVKEFGNEDIPKRMKSKSKSSSFTFLGVFGDFEERLAESEEMVGWIRNNKFDLVIIDTIGNEVMHAVARYWNASVISYSSGSFLFPWEHSLYSIPDETSWLPQFDSYAVEHFGFFDRLSNLFWTGANMWVYNNVYLPKVEASVARIGLDSNLPPMGLSDMIKERTQLLFVNFETWNQFARALPPFVVSVSGMRFNESREPEALPQDIESWLGSGDLQEFIYISFGTATKISTIPESVTSMFMKTLGEINVKFLLKWEGEGPRNVPKNVLVRNWFPQVDVLGHKHIKGFMTQGGQNSMQEAIWNGVPMIIIPVFGDQDITGKFVAQRELGKLMEFSNFTTDSLKENIEEILEKNKYSENVRRMRKVCREMSSESLHRAFSLVEAILRDEDLSHLKPLSVEQPWWKYRSLDTLSVLFFIFHATIAALFYALFKLVMYLLCAGGRSKLSHRLGKTEIGRKLKRR